MVTIGLLNSKGGCGKSVTALALAVGLYERGYKVLLVDADGQANLTEMCGQNSDKLAFTTYEVLKKDCTIQDAIIEGIRKNEQASVDLLPSSASLGGIEIEISNQMRREEILATALKKVAKKYDYCVLDAPPSLGIVVLNLLMAADHIVIPSEPEYYSLRGATALTKVINAVKDYHDVNILGVLLTRVERTINDNLLSVEAGRLAEKLGTTIFDTRIRAQKDVKSSRLTKQSVIEYSRENSKGENNAGSDYNKFVDELLAKLKEQE